MNFLSLFSTYLLTIPKVSVLSGTNITKIIPEPNNITLFQGQYTLPDDISICVSTDISSSEIVTNYFLHILNSHTGKSSTTSICSNNEKKANAGLHIYQESDIEHDGYILSVDNNGIIIKASSLSGFFYASQTLDQIIDSDLTIQYLYIDDAPRFQYRGVMLDVSRHFFNKTTIKLILDEMAFYKMNVFHWHLTDDQGWRIEIKKYPKLTKIGSKRDASPLIQDRTHLDHVPYGPFFYTQEEIKEIVQYAKQLHIDVIPEIEMPGHGVAALAAYPEYSCTGGPFKTECFWGISSDNYCAGNDATLRFLEDILDEVVELFDSKYIHIGGDECIKTCWDNCPKCQKRIRDNNLKDSEELQAWFTNHFKTYLQNKGRQIIGWDEIANSDILSKSAIIMAWRGTEYGMKAINKGSKVIMSPKTYLYLDYGQFHHDKYVYISEFNTIQKIYSYNPTDGVPEQGQDLILGVQGNLWTEYVHTHEELTYKLFPRLCALSEVAWTPNDKKSYELFKNKLIYLHNARMKQKGIDVAPIGPFPLGNWSCEGENIWKKLSWDAPRMSFQNPHYKIDFKFLNGGKTQIRDVKVHHSNVIVGQDNHLSFLNSHYIGTESYQINATINQHGLISISASFKCDKPSEGEVFMDYNYIIPERLDPNLIF